MYRRSFEKSLRKYRSFSTHCRVAVVGGGTAGLAVSSQLAKSGTFTKDDITVFDPHESHHYQPSYTMIGGGVLGTSVADVKKQEHKYVKRSMKSMFAPCGVALRSESVKNFDPDNNKLTTDKGDYTYDFLVVAPG